MNGLATVIVPPLAGVDVGAARAVSNRYTLVVMSPFVVRLPAVSVDSTFTATLPVEAAPLLTTNFHWLPPRGTPSV